MTKSKIALASVSILVTFFIGLRFTNPISQWSTHNDFAHSYITGHLVAKGVDPYKKNDITALYSELKLVNEPPIQIASNPPTLALIFAILQFLGPYSSWFLWILLQIIGLLLIVYFGLQILGNYTHKTFALYLLFLSGSISTLGALQLGQAQLLVGGLTILGFWYVLKSGYPKLGALLIGFSASIKLLTLPCLYPLFLIGGWQLLLLSLSAFFFPLIAWALLFGINSLLYYAGPTLDFVSKSVETFMGTNSITGTTIGLSSALSLNFSNETLYLFGSYFSLLLIVVVIGADIYQSKTDKNPVRSISLALIISIIASPTGWFHYFVLLFFPLMVIQKTIWSLGWAEERKAINFTLIYLAVCNVQGRIEGNSILWELITVCWGLFAALFCIFFIFYFNKKPSSDFPV